MAKKFYDIFDCCREDAELRELLESTTVTAVRIDRASGSLSADLFFPRQPAPVMVSIIENALKAEYGLAAASVSASAPAPQTEETKNGRRQLFGNAIRGKDTPIEELDQYSGKVSVTGDVFGTEKRTVRGGLRIVEFNITDHTGTLRVSKMLRDPADGVLMDIEDGMYLRVAGTVSFNRWVGDLSMEPVSVCRLTKPVRMDECALGRRVELHLHTKFSALDALTDIDEVVKTAARWGHKAIAVTDHGVVQAFPNICSAGKKHGVKILYGCEAYYINDVDDHVAVSGAADEPTDGDFVAFDLETTGLSSRTDAITEIGAVRFSGGKAVDRMDTFVDPGMSIPAEVVRLTGIRDEDVEGAPGQEEAVRRFLEFAGGLPLIAHNAAFDMGFIRAACDRYGLKCENVSVDTLTISRALLTKLKRFSLDVVAGALSLPEFNHHRADADAETCGLIALDFFDRLKKAGVGTLGGINGYLASLRAPEELHGQPRHLIILVKTQQGLRNLYELVSLAHLKYFRKQPIIPKSLLMSKREGLILGSACENGEVFRAVTGNRSDAELDRLASFYDYLEIQPICNNAFMIAEGKAANEDELRAYNKRVVELAVKLGKPVCATGDVHFLDPDDEIFRRILISNKFSDADRPLPIYFKTTDEMMEEFSYLGPELAKKVVIDDPNAIADMIDVVAPLPEGLFPPMIENSARDLQDLVYGKLHAMYGEDPPAIVTDRVEAELKDILARGYDVIYMSAQKLVAKSNAAGYLVGSRGSVGSSVVAFFSGITEVNALPPHYRCIWCHKGFFDVDTKRYHVGVDLPDRDCPICGRRLTKDGFDIPFEVFLGFEGDKVPDIDLNFSGEEQNRAHHYVEELFGRGHVFRAGTISGLADKTAYGYVLKYLEERNKTVSEAEKNRLAAGCVGVKRTTGQHPG
ncbi:MAG: PolC-type DNA polymerase III, partial [Oscillospiraceae bacterium]|nr:PolC-type DNA polymerase III [Oscillospiraceae bacterium]